MFDCVLPTRLGRHGVVWVTGGGEGSKRIVFPCGKTIMYKRVALTQHRYRADKKVLDPQCSCPACREGFSGSYVSHLLRENEILGLRLTTLHNLYFLENIMETLRNSIERIILTILTVRGMPENPAQLGRGSRRESRQGQAPTVSIKTHPRVFFRSNSKVYMAESLPMLFRRVSSVRTVTRVSESSRFRFQTVGATIAIHIVRENAQSATRELKTGVFALT